MPEVTLKFQDRCRSCGVVLPASSRAFWDPATKAVWCALHQPHTHTHSHSQQQRGQQVPVSGGPLSVRRQADEAREAWKEGLRSRWGFLWPLAAWLGGADASVRRWEQGAAGEEKLARELSSWAARCGAVALHDRSIRGRRENLDHLVVSPAGVWVVDAKAHRGPVEVRRGALVVGGRDGSSLTAQSRRQVGFVTQRIREAGIAVPEQVPVVGALCFTQAKVPWRVSGRLVDGAWLGSTASLRRAMARAVTHGQRSGTTLSAEQVQYLAELLHATFPPAQ